MIKIGDKVRLKSGGADMMVENLNTWPDKTTNACCRWHDSNFVPVSGEYNVELLEITGNKSKIGVQS